MSSRGSRAIARTARNHLRSALVVDSNGSVRLGYASAFTDLRGELVGDIDAHAAEERWACYPGVGAALPLGGGRPA